MTKDLKAGMILGSVLVIAVIIWVATRPALSPEARMLQSQSATSHKKADDEPKRLAANPSKEKISAVQTQQSDMQKFHIVRRGETLWEISYKYYGSADKWRKILDANRRAIKNANKLTPGTKLIIPQ